MGHQLNVFLSRVQSRAIHLSGRLSCETWGRALRRWGPHTLPFLIVTAALLVWGLLVPANRFVAIFAALIVLAVGILPWLAVLAFFAVHGLFGWKAELAQRATHKPPRRPDGSVDWTAINSYVLLSEAAWRDTPRTLEALMRGPMNRFIELAEDRSVAIRVRARQMEFSRSVPAAFKKRRARSPQAAEAVDAAIRTELERRLADQGSDGRYLIDVYLGKRTHNG